VNAEKTQAIVFAQKIGLDKKRMAGEEKVAFSAYTSNSANAQT
jgi:hypothetical protein